MFITFEGPEGAGKSTALRSVADRLRNEGLDVLTTREPGAGTTGAKIREILLHGEAIDAKVELFLFFADRANHVSTIIRPALANGAIVLCDRFADSTLVYQSYARGLERTFVEAGNRFATGGLTPDLTILFDIDPRVGLSRIQSKDRLDAEPIGFHERIRDGFLAEAHHDPARWRVIDASQNLIETSNACWNLIDSLIRSTQANT